MLEHEFPILEFDGSSSVMIDPQQHRKPIDIAEHAVACFFQDVITQLAQQHKARTIAHLESEIGTYPVYEIEFEGKRLAVFHPGVGAPWAAFSLEEMIALGCKKFIACGGAGVLNSALAVGHVVVPIAAVRDEGTSYHYLPPAREVQASAAGVAAIESVLQERGCEYVIGKTWTTDGLYRETATKVHRRREEGCITVEMEASAFFAVAQYRGVSFAQLLYSGDDVGGETWDSRNWVSHTSVRVQDDMDDDIVNIQDCGNDEW